MTLVPMHDRILIRRKDSEATTKSGLVIPTAAQEKSSLAIVVAVGTGRVADDGTVVAMSIKPSDTVLIGKWSGDVVKVDDVEHLIIREADVLAVVVED